MSVRSEIRSVINQTHNERKKKPTTNKIQTFFAQMAIFIFERLKFRRLNQRQPQKTVRKRESISDQRFIFELSLIDKELKI